MTFALDRVVNPIPPLPIWQGGLFS